MTHTLYESHITHHNIHMWLIQSMSHIAHIVICDSYIQSMRHIHKEYESHSYRVWVTFIQVWVTFIQSHIWRITTFIRHSRSHMCDVTHAECRLFYRALLQKRPIILSIPLTVATPYVLCDSYIQSMPPDPMNHIKIFKGWPIQNAPSKLVQLWYKSFPPGRFLPGGNEEANYVE